MFNKKLEQRVDRLEKQFITTCQGLTEIRDELKKPKCFEAGDACPENTLLAWCGRRIEAIMDFLDIVVKEEFVEDDNVMKPEMPQKKVWRAHKKVKIGGK